jgi:hypothetical protein
MPVLQGATMTIRLPLRAAIACAALLALSACSSPRALDWNRVSLRDQHLFYPGSGADMRPLAIITAGPNGMVVAGGPPAASEMVVQDGRATLMSSATAQAQRAGATQSLGAGQSLPTPPSGPASQ